MEQLKLAWSILIYASEAKSKIAEEERIQSVKLCKYAGNCLTGRQ